jgi:hypothetical protein
MSLHNVLALSAARSLVQLIHAGGAWKQVFQSPDLHLRYIRALTMWPVPDAILVDSADDAGPACAIEFKPPDSSKGECVRGLGQALTYLSDFESSALVVPDRTSDGFEIAAYLASTKSVPEAVGVYAYPAASVGIETGKIPLDLLKALGGSPSARKPVRRPRVEETFWAFWRDISLQEFFLALDELDRRAGTPNAKSKALAAVFKQYRQRKTNDPQGQPRSKPNISKGHFVGNLGVTLSHLGLWDVDGLPTETGRILVHLGRQFGPESSRFRDAFAQRALIEGRHYELVKLVYEFQQTHRPAADVFRDTLEQFLEDERLLRRLPGRRTTGGRSFFKAEFTFWGQMLRIIRRRGRSYVAAGGVDFDWPRIVDLLKMHQ